MTKLSIIYRANIERDIRITVRSRKSEAPRGLRLIKRPERRR